jgi:hypothetical protein
LKAANTLYPKAHKKRFFFSREVNQYSPLPASLREELIRDAPDDFLVEEDILLKMEITHIFNLISDFHIYFSKIVRRISIFNLVLYKLIAAVVVEAKVYPAVAVHRLLVLA